MVKNLPTGAAQPVTNTNERVRDLLKDRPAWIPPPSERKNFRKHRPEVERNAEPEPTSEADTAEPPETDPDEK